MGVVFTIAAGNSGPAPGTISSQGISRKAITVGAACQPHNNCPSPVANFSSRGPVTWTDRNGRQQTIDKPDIVAPGVAICVADRRLGRTRCVSDIHRSLSGTSMATPHAAWVVALLRQAHPEMNPEQIKQIIMQSATNLVLDRNTQGAGLVNALNALVTVGIPNPFVRITGLPIVFFDNTTTTRIVRLSKTIDLTNLTNDRLTITPSVTSSLPAGVSIQFEPNNLVLGPRASSSLTISLTIDHSLVRTPTYFDRIIVLNSNVGIIRFVMVAHIGPKVLHHTRVVDFGLNNAGQDTWTKTFDLILTNRITDFQFIYNASISSNFSSDAINLKVIPNTIRIEPGGSVRVRLNLTVNNRLLENGRYNGEITFASPLETFTISVIFYNGWALRFYHGDTHVTPGNFILLYNHPTKRLYSVQKKRS